MEFTIEAPGLLQDTAIGKADVKTNGSLLTINSLAGTIGQNNSSGLASVDFAGKPVVKMDLDFQRLDLAVDKRRRSGAIPARRRHRSALERQGGQPGGLNFFDAEMQISAAELRIDRFRFAPISVGAILTNGVLTAGIVRTGVYGGQVQGTVVVDASRRRAKPRAPHRSDWRAGFAAVVGRRQFHALDGRMQAKIDARGRGTNLRAIMSTLVARSICWSRMARFAASTSRK